MNTNSKEFWDRFYLNEIEKGLDQRSDPLRWDLINNYIKDGDKLLDFGCGRGQFLIYLLRNKQRKVIPYGLDISEIALNYAYSQNNRIKIIKNINLLPVSLNFDIITVIHTLEHIKNPKKLIYKLAKLLKPGGLLVVVLPINDDEWPPHYKIWQLEDIIKLLETIPCKYKIFYRKEIVIPKGYRGFKVHTLLCHKDGRKKEEAIIFITFGGD